MSILNFGFSHESIRRHIRNFFRLVSVGLLACVSVCGSSVRAESAGAKLMARYDVTWNSPSKDATGSMPIGNGDLGANVYAVEDGDFYLLLGKTDAFDWQGNVYKTGRVRVRISPNPFIKDKPFRQVLDIVHGCVKVSADGVELKAWVDANNPVYHVEITAPGKVEVTAEPEFWSRPDGIKDEQIQQDNHLIWYHTNGPRSSFPDDLKYYEIPQLAATHPDPFKYNTFGCLLESPQLKLADGRLAGQGRKFDIRIHSLAMQTPQPETWLAALGKLVARKITAKDWSRHCAWWDAFWNRSWIVASDNTLPLDQREHASPPAAPGLRGEKDGGFIVAQGYNVHRYIMASQGRGRYQVQFNGGIFTMPMPNYHKNDGSLYREDERDWGSRFTFQNQRLMYWPMLAAGDFDLMRPFFNYYFSILDLREAITRAWFGQAGAYYRENISLTGGEIDDSPITKNKPPKTLPGQDFPGWYHNYHFNSGLELTAMALDYQRYTDDIKFRDQLLLPLARETIAFYDHHYARDKNGRIRFDPSQVLETFWKAVNPMPDVAGLHFLLDGLLKLGGLPPDDRANWQRLRAELPPIPMREVDGVRILAPADTYTNIHNAENGELYAVFPYRLFGVGRGNEQIVRDTMPHRTVKDAFGGRCWTQDQIDFAYAGMAKEAQAGLIRRFSQYSKYLRLEAFAREQPDYAPDFDSNGSGSIAFQRMLLQEVDGKIYLLPAWPANWDADFKLHAEHQTTVEGRVRNGKLETVKVTPAGATLIVPPTFQPAR